MPRATYIVGLGLAGALAMGPCVGKDLRDLYFGEALFNANQGHYFEALERLDAELALHNGVDEPQRDSLHLHIGEAQFSVGDFELYYRMHHRAGRAIKAVLEGAVDEAVRNEAAYRLARIHFQKDQAADALTALDRISGKVPVVIRDDVEFLRANVYLALGRPAEATTVLKRLQGAQSLTGFAAYNLGIAMLQEGRQQDAISQLDRAGQLGVSDAGPLAIRDKSNMLLGKMMLESTDFARAQLFFDRVRLDGPFSNQALLSAGWADVSAQNFERAVVPWSILAKRELTDSAVQEALLALPYAYSKLNVHGRAAVLYGDALKSFGEELNKVDASMKSIADGRFLRALAREEIQQDKGWVIRLRTLPDAPETFYLMQLLASHDFQTALQNYLDLEELRKKMAGWQKGLDAYEDMIRLRKQNYDPLLPSIDAQFRELDAQVRLRMEQRNHLQQRLQQLLIEPRPDLLATADERIALESIRQIEAAPAEGEGRRRIAAPAARASSEGRAHLDAVHELSGASDRGARALERAECGRRGADEAVSAVRTHATGRGAQLHRLWRHDQSSAHARRRSIADGQSADGEAGPPDRDRRDRRAQDAACASRGLSDTGALRRGRQLRPRRQGARQPDTRSGCCAGRGRTMMRAHRAMSVVGAAVLAACSSAPPKDTLATLHKVQPDLQDVKVEGGLDTAMQSYQRFLEETPETKRTPEAMRRLADLKIEKEYGLNGTGEMLELPAPQTADVRLKPDLQPPVKARLEAM